MTSESEHKTNCWDTNFGNRIVFMSLSTENELSKEITSLLCFKNMLVHITESDMKP